MSNLHSTRLEPSGPRVLLCGMPASGKTTLAATLHQTLGLPIVGEAARDLGEVGLDIGASTPASSAAAIAVVQMHREGELSSFVADRGAIDVMAYARSRMAQHEDALSKIVAPALITFAEAWFRATQYDLVVYHAHPLGGRGRRLMLKQVKYMNSLAMEFRRSLDDLDIKALEMPPGLSVAQCARLVAGALDAA